MRLWLPISIINLNWCIQLADKMMSSVEFSITQKLDVTPSCCSLNVRSGIVIMP